MKYQSEKTDTKAEYDSLIESVAAVLYECGLINKEQLEYILCSIR